MKKELKFIIGETAGDVHVLVNNQPVGFIQEVKFCVGTESNPQVEFVFPDLRPYSEDAARKVADQIGLLAGLPHVKVSLQKVEFPKT